ncbi:MAG: serine/threonine-protein kinase [Elainellaceae cyanobacterium]
MSYCLNPACPSPKNPPDNSPLDNSPLDNSSLDKSSLDKRQCQGCGKPLLLAERYQALEPIGEGGFGRTFVAIDVTQPASPRCVIKQILPRQGDRHTRDEIERFRQEAARLKQLGNHPQIPQFFDAIELPDAHYLVQEYIEGRNMESLLEERGSFPPRGIRQLLNDLLPVLSYVHDQRVIHRDIKPQNLIAPPDNSPVVLVDFGASKFATGTALARTGTLIGSAGYLAPEQAMGKAVFSSDLYSLGVTCAHLMTGIHPFELYSVSQDGWIWKQYLLEPIGDELAYVIDKMLRRAPNQRYRTAAAILEDLRSPPAAVTQAQSRSKSYSLPKFIAPKESRNLALDAGYGLENASPDGVDDMEPMEDGGAYPRKSWDCLHQLTGHGGAITAVAVSPSSQIIASGSTDRRIILWNLQSGTKLHTFEGRSLWNNSGHGDRINALRFTPNGSALISASDDGTIKLWDLAERKMISTLSSSEWVISAIAISPDGNLLVSGGANGAIELWDLERGEFIERLWKHDDRISGLVFNPQGQTLISSSWDGTLRLWDLRTADLLDTLKAHRNRVGAIATSADWRVLVSSSWDGELTFWDMERGEAIRTIQAHRDAVRYLAAHAHAGLFASAGDDAQVNLWSVSSNLRYGDAPRAAYEAQKGQSDRYPRSAQPGDGSVIRVDEKERSPQPLATVRRFCVLKHAWSVNALDFSPDGLFLVSGSADESIKVWQQSDSISPH